MSISMDNPFLGDKPDMAKSLYGTVNVDLGSGVGIRWVHYDGEIMGGVLVHDKPDGHLEKCEGAFNILGSKYFARPDLTESERAQAKWSFNGDYEKPDLNPSFLCHCGFHGFVRNGKWQQA